jgi:hypothetical protein
MYRQTLTAGVNIPAYHRWNYSDVTNTPRHREAPVHHPDVLHELARYELRDRLNQATRQQRAAEGRRRYRHRKDRSNPLF